MHWKAEWRRMRLLEILVMRRQWQAQVAEVQRMHGWVRAAEHILSGQWAEPGVTITNAQVAERFDSWRHQFTLPQDGEALSDEQQRCLEQFLKVTTHLRPWLVQCYDVAGLPRTDNALEDTIRAIKQRYRRISGRKNWNSYVLRYGRYVSFYEWLGRGGSSPCRLESFLSGITWEQWRAGSAALRQRRAEQSKKHRFRHHRERYLACLEARWGQSAADAAE